MAVLVTASPQIPVAMPQPAPPANVQSSFLQQSPLPPANNSYIFWDSRLSLLSDVRCSLHKPLVRPQPPVQAGQNLQLAQPLPMNASFAPATGGAVAPETTTIPDIIQQNMNATYKLRMFGYALRLGHTVPVPRIASVSGVPITLLKSLVTPFQWNAIGGLIVYGCSWDCWYVLPKSFPGLLPIMSNPMLP